MTPEPSPSPDAVVTSIATTVGATAAATDSHAAGVTESTETGLVWPSFPTPELWLVPVASSSRSDVVRAAVPPPTRSAVTAAVDTTAGHRRFLRAGGCGANAEPGAVGLPGAPVADGGAGTGPGWGAAGTGSVMLSFMVTSLGRSITTEAPGVFLEPS